MILFDIDETLISKGEETAHANVIKEQIQALIESKNLIFGVWSQRPLDFCLKVYNFFNFNGPIIAEGGGIFIESQDKPLKYFTDPDFKKSIISKTSEFCKGNDLEPLQCGSPTSFKIDHKAFLLNNDRLHVLTLYFPVNLKKYLETFEIWLKESLKNQYSELSIKRFNSDLKLKISACNITKSLAIKKFIPTSRVHLISDIEEDISRNKSIIFYSVGNSDIYNSLFHYVAEEKGPAGVCQVLNYINNKV